MRFNLITPELIQIRESMGLVKDVYDPLSSVKQPLSEYRTMLDLIHRDTTIATAYDIIVDFATYRGFDFTGSDKSQRDNYRKLFDSLNFRQVSTNLIYSLLYYGDAFLELRKSNSTTPNELWVLETTEMRIKYDKHGKVEGYVQRPFNMSGMNEKDIIEKERTQGIFFNPDEVIHFRMKWIGSQVYSYNPNEPLSTVASTKLYAGNYLMNIFINMPPRYVAHLSGISLKDYETAKREFQSAKTNYKRTIAFSRSSDPQSKLSIQKIDPPYDKELMEIMKWLNNEILKVTRVPRSWLEESGTENRGVTESEQRPFDVRVQAIHRNIIEPPINRYLIPALNQHKEVNQYQNPKTTQRISEPGTGKAPPVFRFNEISRKGEKEILQNVGLLRDMGLKPEALVNYLDERGILGLDPTDFDEMQLRKNMELNTSRQRMDKGVADMTQNRNEAGVSEQSAAKMEV